MPTVQGSSLVIENSSDDEGQLIRSLRDAEFAVASAVSVREQYKAKLQTLVSGMTPSGCPVVPSHRSLPAGPTRGHELHVVGDLLLLLRAASVNVVECIQAWRQGMPRPYIHDRHNYLLTMCEDTNFLDQVLHT